MQCSIYLKLTEEISPFGPNGDFHGRRYSRFAVIYYSFTSKCLGRKASIWCNVRVNRFQAIISILSVLRKHLKKPRSIRSGAFSLIIDHKLGYYGHV
ncbi:hypothetical protein D3OALGA1CA_4438 [Olavius algarvensis associated proteobacterium Delta 3]|nr:hypothetical protein D3OALGB2SA_3678 [Olavius algarvensis associated proteobacterium Delta 3]CAB5151276.1 hypothetical protein D3OALGA1CA_4438 [Olavius algarvensis associated proteobacterium Delta 3]